MEKKALALKYEQGLPAPFLLAKGKGLITEKILALAEEKGIQIVYNEELTENLFYLECGNWIPEDYFEILAEIFAFVYRVRKEK